MSLRERVFHGDRIDAERELREAADYGGETLWVRRDWTEALGAARVQAIVAEYGYGEVRDWREEARKRRP